ncbi:MAG: UvrD-helicase domain-containing protein [Solirubrobacteraceae bacterium]
MSDTNTSTPAPPPDRRRSGPPAQRTGRKPKALEGLNLQQEEAVMHGGHVLGLAGAGTGKTRLLASKAAYLINVEGERPEDILAITLTNKAARQMKRRIRKLSGPAADRVQACTFHAMCSRLLRSHAELIGRSTRFTIYDEDNQMRVFRRLVTQADAACIPLRDITDEISKCKNQAVTLARYAKFATDERSRVVARVWSEYEAELRRSDALDFDDLLLRTVQLLHAREDLRDAYRMCWPVVLVDEYQDTNPIQARLLRLLVKCPENRHFMAVGDDRQVIYGFRLANVDLILGFENEYRGATVVKLERNYRNPQRFLDAANRLIDHNKRQFKLKVFADKKNPVGEPITVHRSATDTKEAQWIASRILRLLEQGEKEGDIAVLARHKGVVDKVEHALAAAGISYQRTGGQTFFGSPEVSAALAHLRLIVNPCDEAAFAAALEIRPKIGAITVAKVIGYASRHGLTLLEAALAADLLPGQITNTARENIRRFALDMLAFTARAESRSVSALTYDVIHMPLGVAEAFASDRETERCVGRLDALCEAAETYERQADEPALAGWLADVVLTGRDDLSAATSDGGRVTIGTFHSVKGLEWDIVIGAGIEGRICPFVLAVTDEEIEEERRMLYVLFTRAKRILILSYAMHRNGRQSGPSRFYKESLVAPAAEAHRPLARAA